MITINKDIEKLAERARQKGYTADEMHEEEAVCLRPAKQNRILTDFPELSADDFTESLGGILLVNFS